MSDELEQWQCEDDAGFAGRVHEPLYNRLPFERMPARLVRPTNERQVVQAIEDARAAGQRIALRSGGNSWIGAGVRDGGMLMDLGALDALRIDPAARRAWVGPAVRSRDLVRALARHGLAFPVGHCGAPAMGGYLMGGGLGFNWGTWQPACFSVTGLRAVTADGRCLTANADQNAELLWMARGAGPGFPAVVTEFELALCDRPKDTRLSVWHFALDAVDEVTRWVNEASAALGPNIEIAVTTIGPDRTALLPGPGIPDQLLQVAAIAYVDSEDAARAALRPLHDTPAPPALLFEPLMAVPFEELDLGAEVAHPPGHRVLGDTFWTDHDIHAVMSAVEPLVQRAPSGKNSVVALMPAHGAAKAGVPRGAGAYSMDHRTLVLAFATWSDPVDDAVNHDWMNELVPVLEAMSSGHFLSEADLLRDAHRAQRCFGAAEWARLEQLRQVWDPEGRFHTFPAPG
jgi:FAD/FMN-containing dehydrogenase